MKRPFLEFSPTITAGNILQIVTIGIAVVAAYTNIQVRLARNEDKVATLANAVEKVSASQDRTAQALDRVAARMDQHMKFPSVKIE